MHPVPEDDDALTQLESRISQLSNILKSYRDRSSGLEARVRELEAEKKQALEDAEAARTQAARLAEEVDGLRNRNKQAASRIKALLGQIEQMDLLAEN